MSLMKSLVILSLLAFVYICFFGIIEGIERMHEAERQAVGPMRLPCETTAHSDNP